MKFRLLHKLTMALLLLTGQFVDVVAQTVVVPDSIVAAVDSMYNAMQADSILAQADSVATSLLAVPEPELKLQKPRRDWSTWHPKPQKALWLALVIPGGGQIYNRKYWKLPLIYGGFVGCAYAMSWNNTMYRDYSQAYLDLMDDDPGTHSYDQFSHLRQIDSTNEERYKTLFKKRKDRFRRWRDMSFFVMVGVYALSVIDAYVDAELSEFDISKDLSLKVSPTVIGTSNTAQPLFATSIGMSCSFNF